MPEALRSVTWKGLSVSQLHPDNILLPSTAMAQKNNAKLLTCPYCRCSMRKRDSTRDHLPPKSLFPNPKPINLKTVRCCLKCHRAESNGDEIIKILSAFGRVRSRSASLLKEDANRAYRRGSWWQRHLQNGAVNAQQINIKLGGEEFRALALPLSPEITDALDQSIRRIVIGLLFDHDPLWNAVACKFVVKQVSEDQLDSKFVEAMNAVGPMRYRYSIGDNVFNAAWDFAREDNRFGVTAIP